jgi:hypothetical protein
MLGIAIVPETLVYNVIGPDCHRGALGVMGDLAILRRIWAIFDYLLSWRG